MIVRSKLQSNLGMYEAHHKQNLLQGLITKDQSHNAVPMNLPTIGSFT